MPTKDEIADSRPIARKRGRILRTVTVTDPLSGKPIKTMKMDRRTALGMLQSDQFLSQPSFRGDILRSFPDLRKRIQGGLEDEPGDTITVDPVQRAKKKDDA